MMVRLNSFAGMFPSLNPVSSDSVYVTPAAPATQTCYFCEPTIPIRVTLLLCWGWFAGMMDVRPQQVSLSQEAQVLSQLSHRPCERAAEQENPQAPSHALHIKWTPVAMEARLGGAGHRLSRSNFHQSVCPAALSL